MPLVSGSREVKMAANMAGIVKTMYGTGLGGWPISKTKGATIAPTLELNDCIPIAPDRSEVGNSSSGQTYTMENADVMAVLPTIAKTVRSPAEECCKKIIRKQANPPTANESTMVPFLPVRGLFKPIHASRMPGNSARACQQKSAYLHSC